MKSAIARRVLLATMAAAIALPLTGTGTHKASAQVLSQELLCQSFFDTQDLTNWVLNGCDTPSLYTNWNWYRPSIFGSNSNYWNHGYGYRGWNWNHGHRDWDDHGGNNWNHGGNNWNHGGNNDGDGGHSSSSCHRR